MKQFILDSLKTFFAPLIYFHKNSEESVALGTILLVLSIGILVVTSNIPAFGASLIIALIFFFYGIVKNSLDYKREQEIILNNQRMRQQRENRIGRNITRSIDRSVDESVDLTVG